MKPLCFQEASSEGPEMVFSFYGLWSSMYLVAALNGPLKACFAVLGIAGTFLFFDGPK